MTHFEHPRIVRWVADAVSSRLGRPASIRAEKNGAYWCVSDPIFSYLQIGLRTGVTDDRVGFFVENAPNAISFGFSHTPAIAQSFRRNISFESVLSALDATQQYRKVNSIHYSSKSQAKRGGNIECFESKSYLKFRAALVCQNEQSSIVRDLFATLPNQGKGQGKARKAGNHFRLELANRASSFPTKSHISEIVASAWPLLQCLYPPQSPRKRDAKLAARLRTAGFSQACEFAVIKGREVFDIESSCKGRIEGAHIKPDAIGGSDEPGNGLWLCQRHHRAYEGLLSGKRGNVRAIGRKLFNQADF